MKYKVTLILIVLLGFFLRIQGLNQSLWLDESIQTLAVKNNSLLHLITTYSLGDFHPPFYHVVLKLWTDLFGYSEFSVRMPSVIFSTLTGLFIFLIGKKLKNEKVGLIAAFLWMINPLAIYYGQEARMYSLAAFGVAGAVWFFLQKNWLWYFVFFLIALSSDYLPFLMFPVFFLLSEDKKKFVLINSLFIIPFLAWAPFFYQQFQIGTRFAQAAPGWSEVVGAGTIKSLPLTFVKFTVGRITIQDKILYGVVFGTSVLFCFYLILRAGKQTLLWSWLLIPLILGFIISFKISIFSYFRFLFVLPAYVLLLALGTKEKAWAIIVITLIFLSATIYFKITPEAQRENWKAAVVYINSEQGQVVLPSVAQNAPLKYYSESQVVEDKDNFVPKEKTIYLIRYVQEIFDPSDSLRKSLEKNGYQKTEEKGLNGVLIWKYQQS